LGLLLLLVHVFLIKAYTVDDAFISFRVLKQFVAGNGLVYNIGEHVEAYSNFAWVMLLTPGTALGFDPVQLSQLLGLVCMGIALICTWGITYQLSPHTFAAGLAPILMASLTGVAFWSVAGLETPEVTAVIAALTWSLLRETKGGPAWLTGLLLGLLALSRPEMLLIVGLTWAWELLRNLQQGKPLLSRNLLWHVGLFAIIYLPYTAWRVFYYGNLLPTTVRAKSTGLQLHTLIRGAYYVLNFLSQPGIMVLVGLAILGASLLLGVSDLRWSLLYLVAIVLVYMLTTALAGGDWMPVSRVFVHLLPLLVALASCGIILVGQWLLSIIKSKRLLTGLASGLLLLQLGVCLFDGVDPNGSLSSGLGRVNGFGEWVKTLQPGDTIMVVEAGWLPYNVPLTVRVVDMIGLADNHIANQNASFPDGPFGHYNVFGKWDVDYYLAQNARFVSPSYLSTASDGHIQTGFIGATELVNDPRFQALYFMRPDHIFERRK
jgi:hypothetical protein